MGAHVYFSVLINSFESLFLFFSNPITFRSDTVNIPAQNYHPCFGKECQILCVFFLAGVYALG